MTPELSAALIGVTQDSVMRMKGEEHSNLQDLKEMQKGGQATKDEFAKSRKVKVKHIERINQARRELLTTAVLDAKRQQVQERSQGSAESQKMDAILAELRDVTQRLEKLERDR